MLKFQNLYFDLLVFSCLSLIRDCHSLISSCTISHQLIPWNELMIILCTRKSHLLWQAASFHRLDLLKSVNLINSSHNMRTSFLSSSNLTILRCFRLNSEIFWLKNILLFVIHSEQKINPVKVLACYPEISRNGFRGFLQFFSRSFFPVFFKMCSKT